MTTPSTPATASRRRTVIEPPRAWEGLGLRACAEHRDLLGAFAMRDIRLRYRQTALGIAWVVLQPLLGAGLFAFVFGKVARLGSHGVPYFVFSFAGLLGWTLFANVIAKAGSVMIQNAGVITKIYFPRILLPLSAMLSSLVDFAIGLGVMAILLVTAHIGVAPRILLFPVWIAMLLVLALGCGLIAGALGVKYRDVPYITPVLLQFLIYGSPVGYGMMDVPARLQHWLWLNPVSAPLEACRWSLLGIGELNARALGYSAIIAVAVLGIGAWLFNWLESSFADVI
ncbi:MAG TPA: ABC transporter permease [Chthoniobacteraceae bacterium]|nr:ABC transporter permease [Chthoniobacteraceae bacterium]